MKFAYADPVYLGCSKLYPEHPNSAAWDDPEMHRTLINMLCLACPDGWAMSLSTPSLRVILPMCPPEARIGSWVKTFCAFKKGVRPCYAWEPVIFYRGRNKNHPPPEKGGKQTTPKDFLLDDSGDTAFAGPITLKKGLTGAKSEKFCEWVLDLLNVLPGDEVVDVFPGTGVMGRVAAGRTA
jgi:hypothetical protein